MVPRKYLFLLSMTGLLVSFDQLTKNLVVSCFHVGDSVAILGNFFNITRVHNAGAAFGLLASLPNHLREVFFFLVPGFTLLVILFVFHKLRDSQFLSMCGLAMIVGGALGNLADRLRLGFVIDFLDFHWNNAAHFPAFNIADTAITTGVGLLLLGMLFEREQKMAKLH